MASDGCVLLALIAAARVAAAPTDPITAPAISFSQTAPVLIVLGGAVLAILFEAFLPRAARYPVQVGLAVVVVAAALVWTLVGARNSDYGVTFGGAVAVDAATYVMWGVLLVLALPSVLLMADRVSEPGGAFVTQAAAKVGLAHATGWPPGSRRRCRPRSSRWRCSPSAG